MLCLHTLAAAKHTQRFSHYFQIKSQRPTRSCGKLSKRPSILICLIRSLFTCYLILNLHRSTHSRIHFQTLQCLVVTFTLGIYTYISYVIKQKNCSFYILMIYILACTVNNQFTLDRIRGSKLASKDVLHSSINPKAFKILCP